MKNILKILVVFFLALLIGGCSSNSSESLVKGYFVDDPVAGLSYTCSSGTSGVTASDGGYSCEEGDNVSFFIGDIPIGTVVAQVGIVTPYSLFPNNQDAALNLARLLQSLDSNTSDNIITFDSNLITLLDVNTDFESPTFVADIQGDLNITLVSVQDAQTQLNETMASMGESVPDGANIPIAVAGVDQNIHNGDVVTLDGSASSDADGDTLSYLWSMSSKPVSSSAVLSNANIVNPSFTTDESGNYVLELIVNDGGVSSSPDEVIIVSTRGNAAPVADAGTNQNVNTTDIVELNASNSSDADADSLTYSWSITSKPATSIATLSDSTIINPTFEADLDGDYNISLVVNDGIVDSAPDSVTITASTVNSAPVANAGPDQYIETGLTVTLNGSGSSDVNSDSLTYAWSITSKPVGSTTVLANDTEVNPSLVPDLEGTYIIGLVVNDGVLDSSNTDTVSIGSIPAVASHHSFSYSWVVSPYTQRVWLDRNLGAGQVCTANNDTSCYGDYYQWGRNTDGHEKSTSEVTNVKAISITHVGIYYIAAQEWIDTEHNPDIDNNGALRSQNWSKTDGSSVCPLGYRVPTSDEIVSETSSVSSHIAAYYNFLKLPSNGYRNTNGIMASYDNQTSLWTSEPGSGREDDESLYRYFSSYGATSDDLVRGKGFGVRCIKH